MTAEQERKKQRQEHNLWYLALIAALATSNYALVEKLLGAAYLMTIRDMDRVGLYYGVRTP